MNILRNVPTHDAPIDRYGRTAPYRPEFRNVRSHGYHLGDDMLNAIPNGKCLVLGRVWKGDLEPVVDSYIEALKPIVSGFSAGRVLNAEPAPATLNLGRTWIGTATKQIAGSHDEAGDVDVSELLVALSHLHNALAGGSKAGNQLAKDAFRRVLAARDGIVSGLIGGIGRGISAVGHFAQGVGEAVGGAAHVLKPAGAGGGTRTGGASGEGESEDGDVLAENATQRSALRHGGVGMGDSQLVRLRASERDRIRQQQRAADSYWIKRNGTGHTATSDAAYPTAVRDALHAVNSAKDPYEKLRAMNALNRARAAQRP